MFLVLFGLMAPFDGSVDGIASAAVMGRGDVRR
jgi:hypothetical protein